MDITTIREKLHNFIDTAEDEKVIELLSFVENEPEEKYDHWEDEEFVAEIKNRIDDYETGRVKSIPWEEVKLNARNKLASKNK